MTTTTETETTEASETATEKDDDAYVNDSFDDLIEKVLLNDDDDSVNELIDLVEKTTITSPYEEEVVVDENILLASSWIQESENIVVVCGAGISCSAGIPDFRTPGTGLYDNLQKYNLPTPQHVFDIEYYKRRPQAFCSLAKELWPGIQHSPTLTHSFLSYLSVEQKKIKRIYTQNIDGLEQLARIPEDVLIECHGHFRSASCIRCRAPMDGNECKRLILEGSDIPTCPRCHSYVKPDIVFFGEGLPKRFHSCLKNDVVSNVDLVIVMGTSLMVAPVSSIPDYLGCGRQILINKEAVGNFCYPSVNKIALLGDCDTMCLQLASQLSFEKEIRELNQQTKIVDDNEEG